MNFGSAFSNHRTNFTESNSFTLNEWFVYSSKKSSASNFSSLSYTSSHSGFQRVQGSFAESIGFTTSLSSSNQFLVEDYLRYKYAPPVNLGKDIIVPYGFCDTVIHTNIGFEDYLWSSGSTENSITASEPGTYWVECTDLFGLVTRDTILVSFPQYNLPQNTIFCPNNFVDWNPISGSGYNFIWSDGTTEQINSIGVSGDYFVTISDSNGCSFETEMFFFNEDTYPSIVSLGNDTSICSGNEILFINGFENSESFSWSTLDSTQSIIIETSGSYSIQAVNDNNCIGIDTIEVTIIGTAPSLAYSIENEICQGSEFNYSENSTVPPGNTIDEIIWNFGELDSVFISEGIQVYLDSGVYNGFLEVSTIEGCSNSEEFTITVHPKPIVTFETTNFCPYEDISFEASNDYGIPLNSFNWNFDQEGNTSVQINPSYNYGITGNYDVQLIAIDSNQCADTVIQTVFIQPAPFANVTIANTCERSELEITNNSSIADTFSIASYSWDYGDGTSSTNPTIDKFYESYGEYNIEVILTADNGCKDTVYQTITVHPNPILDYTVGPACKNTWTALENTSTIPLGSLSETNWLINLQFTNIETNTAFNFPTTGIQFVNLEAVSDKSCALDTTFEIDVQDELHADFSVSPSIIVSDIPILFNNLSIGSDSSYWNFGDGNGFNLNSNSLNEIIYPASLNGSSVQVSLITNNNIGCRDTSVQNFQIKEAFFDINLQTLFAQEINGFLTVGVEIQNIGTIPIENLDLLLKTPENGLVLENWIGTLAQNESEIYIFSAHPSAFISTQDETERFVCVEAQNSNPSFYLDVNQENNTTCKNIEGSRLVLLPVYPNPSAEDLTISVLASEISTIDVAIKDKTGRVVYEIKSSQIETGISTYSIPFSQFSSGMYILSITDNNQSIVERVVRL